MDKCAALAHPLPTLGALPPTSPPLLQQRFMEKATAPAPAGFRITPSSQEIRLRNTPTNSRGVPTRECEKQQALAEGEFADIIGCYPGEVTKDCDEGGVVALGGGGLMTLSSVMGTAFIRGYRLHEKLPSVPFLAVSEEYRERIPTEFGVRVVKGERYGTVLSIDWLRTESAIVDSIQARGGLSAPQSPHLFKAIRDYCEEYPELRVKWSTELSKFLGFCLEKL